MPSRKSPAQLDREIAEYLAKRGPRISPLSGDLTDDEYASIVVYLTRKRIPFTPFSGGIRLSADSFIRSAADAFKIGWRPRSSSAQPRTKKRRYGPHRPSDDLA